jgi:ADP-heptose:LPS heptosyltransferase
MNNPRIWLGRGTMLGDILATIPVAIYLKKIYKNCTIVWAMGKKSGQSAMLYFRHPAIDEIYICDGAEGPESYEDFQKMNSCDIKFNLNPSHRDNEYPAKKRDIYWESFHMQGFEDWLWEVNMLESEKIPKLVKWWNPVKRPFGDKKTVFFTGMPNFGRESKRWVSKRYLEDLAIRLIGSGYYVIQSGGEQDEHWFRDGIYPLDRSKHLRINDRSFFEQIQIANEADLIVGSDSGMSLICGAYQKQMVSMIPIHWGNENNPTALSTNNPNNYSFYSFSGTDNIDMDLVLAKIVEKLNHKA